MISEKMKQLASNNSVIRAMFEEGQNMAREFGAENVYDFSLGNPSVPAPAAVKDAIREILDQEDSLMVHGYMSNVGYQDVRQAVAESLNRRFGTDFHENNIIMTVGAAGGLNVILKTLLNPGDEVLTFAPYFTEYGNYVANYDGKLVVVSPNTVDFQPNLKEFAEKITPRTKAVIVNNPNNPTGVVYSAETCREMSRILREKQHEFGTDIYLISDEPYRELAYDGVEVPYLTEYYANTVVCYSWSKSLSLPGERIGYLAVNPKAEQAMTIAEVCPQISRTIGCNGTSTLMQLTVGRCADLTSQLEIYERNKDRLFSALTEYGFSCVEPGGSFYMFPRSLEPDDVAFCKKATELDLFLVPGTAFGCPGHFRLAYCVPEERVVAALPRFRQLAERYQRQKG